jgi:CRISPR/Cas system-associated exonuclease Cas4 (RecB family)
MTTKKRSWSLSTWNLFNQCAFKYKCIKIDKIEEPPSYHLLKGLAAHNLAEQFLQGKIDAVPAQLMKFRNEFINLRKNEAIPEEALTFNDKWELIPDGWFSPEAWLRMKLDARIGNYVIDFKTGKHYEEHVDQARLYANAHMMHTGDKEVHVEFWYLTSGDVKEYLYDQSTLEADVEEWNKKAERIQNETEFAPTINLYCKYCHVKKICPAFKKTR